MSGLIWVQNVSKGYQQKTKSPLVGKRVKGSLFGGWGRGVCVVGEVSGSITPYHAYSEILTSP